MAASRIEDLHRDARRSQSGTRSDKRRAGKPLASPITIRRATEEDAEALERLAELDSSEVPAVPVLLAEVDGEVRAAASLATGAVVANPFHQTAAIVELLRAAAAHERKDRGSRLRSRIRRALGGSGRRSGAPAESRSAGASITSGGTEAAT